VTAAQQSTRLPQYQFTTRRPTIQGNNETPESAGMNLSKMNKELPAGSTLLHYRIVSKIGAGGMSEVYSTPGHKTGPESGNQIPARRI
jgi:hypothetical protein